MASGEGITQVRHSRAAGSPSRTRLDAFSSPPQPIDAISAAVDASAASHLSTRSTGRILAYSRPVAQPTRRSGGEPIQTTPIAPEDTRWLVALLALSLWSILPPYLGPAIGLELDVSAATEVVDHLLPGVIAAAAAGYALYLARRGETDSLHALGALGVCALAGLWESASHFPLVLDAGDSARPWGAVLFHSTAGPAVLVLALWLLVRGPSSAAERA